VEARSERVSSVFEPKGSSGVLPAEAEPVEHQLGILSLLCVVEK
jgi:hypothetical protein